MFIIGLYLLEPKFIIAYHKFTVAASHAFFLGPNVSPMKTSGPFQKSSGPQVGLRAHVEKH